MCQGCLRARSCSRPAPRARGSCVLTKDGDAVQRVIPGERANRVVDGHVHVHVHGAVWSLSKESSVARMRRAGR